MGKQYVVKHGAVGTFPEGHVLTAEELATFPEGRVAQLVISGALAEATPEAQATQDTARDLPTGTTAKAVTLDSASVTLTTGQPGGAPTPNTAQAQQDAADGTSSRTIRGTK